MCESLYGYWLNYNVAVKIWEEHNICFAFELQCIFQMFVFIMTYDLFSKQKQDFI